MKLLAFADIIWDVYPDTAVIGGAGLNFCAHAVKCGMMGDLYSAVGKDEYGKRALQELCRLKVGRRFVQKNSFVTGKSIVTLSEGGQPSFEVLQNTAYDNIVTDDTLISKIKKEKYDAFYFGTLQQRGKTSRESLCRILNECSFKEVFCDINLRANCFDEESVKNVLDNATILKISEEEKPMLNVFPFWAVRYSQNDFAEKLFSDYPKLHTVLYTMGEVGSVIYLRGGKNVLVPAPRTEAVSAVGAGDSYGAAYLACILAGKSVEEAGAAASIVSAKVVSVTEAVPDYSLKKLISSKTEKKAEE